MPFLTGKDHSGHTYGPALALFRTVALVCVLWFPLSLHAHAPSDTFLSFTLTATNVSGRWEIKLRDLQHALGLDKTDAVTANPQDLRLRQEALGLDTVSGLVLRLDDKRLPLRVDDEQWEPRPDGESLILTFQSDGFGELQRRAGESPPYHPSRFSLNAQILFALDPQMRCIMRLKYWGEPQQTVLSAMNPRLDITLAAPPSKLQQLLAFLHEGIWHIWTGYDHILFLIALLLPAVLIWHEHRWDGTVKFRSVIINVLKIVTAFTLAHSLTLALASLKIVMLPTRWVESVIAGSVVVAAMNNLVPLFRERGWIVAFGFGLIHGFGFANVLNEAGLAGGSLVMALIGFNVGVEIGQLAIVSLFVPLAYHFRQTTAYRTFALRGGSVVVIAVAAISMAERMFDFKVLPF